MKRRIHLRGATLAALAAATRRPSGDDRLHLEACPECARRLADLTAIVGSLRLGAAEAGESGLPDRLPEPPRPGLLPEPALADLLSRQVPGASLEAPAGLRSAAPATSQWHFQAGELELDLQAFPEGPEQRRLMGQALGPKGNLADLAVHLRVEGSARITSTDRHGEFSFPAVRGSEVIILVETDEEVFRLDLGPVPDTEDTGR